jgi:nicotinamide mononucleotide adenylyltransferase
MVRQSDPIPGLLRQTWLSSTHPTVTVRLVAHDLPTDYADPETWSRWISLISANLDAPIDAVFSSEPYGDELARRLNSHHRVVDPRRAAFPVSATDILARPQAHARFVAPEVLAYLCSRQSSDPGG